MSFYTNDPNDYLPTTDPEQLAKLAKRENFKVINVDRVWDFSLKAGQTKQVVSLNCQHWFNDSQNALLNSMGYSLSPVGIRLFNTYSPQAKPPYKYTDGGPLLGGPWVRMAYLNVLGFWSKVSSALDENPSRFKQWILATDPVGNGSFEDMVMECMLDANNANKTALEDLRLMFTKTGERIYPNGFLLHKIGFSAGKKPNMVRQIALVEPYVTKAGSKIPYPRFKAVCNSSVTAVIDKSVDKAIKKDKKELGVFKFPVLDVQRTEGDKVPAVGDSWIFDDWIHARDIVEMELEYPPVWVMNRETLKQKLTAFGNFKYYQMRASSSNPNCTSGLEDKSLEELLDIICEEFGCNDSDVFVPEVHDTAMVVAPYTPSQLFAHYPELENSESLDADELPF